MMGRGEPHVAFMLALLWFSVILPLLFVLQLNIIIALMQFKSHVVNSSCSVWFTACSPISLLLVRCNFHPLSVYPP